MRHPLPIALAVVSLLPAAVLAQADDPELARGITQVEEGDYDAAILTLDGAARRLAGDPARARDLSQAYLYLGVAYVGKGHDAAAKAKFREAVRQLRDLTLSPEKFPPKVIDLFEAAKDEANRAAGAVPGPATAPTPAPPVAPEKKGGGRTLLWVGLGGAAAAGAALALGGGEDAASASGSEETFTGFISGSDEVRDHSFNVGGTGSLQARATWTVSGGTGTTFLALELKDPSFNLVAEGTRTGAMETRLSASVTPGQYILRVLHAESCNGCVANYMVRVNKP